jgi:hypothetical protein
MPTIQKGIDIPKSKRWAKWPFAEMEKGDCMTLETEEEFRKARSAAYAFASRNTEYTFTCRQDDGGFRIWREK